MFQNFEHILEIYPKILNLDLLFIILPHLFYHITESGGGGGGGGILSCIIKRQS